MAVIVKSIFKFFKHLDQESLVNEPGPHGSLVKILWERSGSVGRMLDSGSNGRELETHRRHCVVSLSRTLYPLLQDKKTGNCPDITKKCLLGRKVSYQIIKSFRKPRTKGFFFFNCSKSLVYRLATYVLKSLDLIPFIIIKPWHSFGNIANDR